MEASHGDGVSARTYKSPKQNSSHFLFSISSMEKKESHGDIFKKLPYEHYISGSRVRTLLLIPRSSSHAPVPSRWALVRGFAPLPLSPPLLHVLHP